jgi:hypothetical protein
MFIQDFYSVRYLASYCPCVVYAENKRRVMHLVNEGSPDPTHGVSVFNNDCMLYGCLRVLLRTSCFLQVNYCSHLIHCLSPLPMPISHIRSLLSPSQLHRLIQLGRFANAITSGAAQRRTFSTHVVAPRVIFCDRDGRLSSKSRVSSKSTSSPRNPHNTQALLHQSTSDLRP